MELILFTYGDSNKASTWSNVPYLMAQSFERKNIIVHRINICPNKYIDILANKLFSRVLKWVGYSYIRTPLFRKITKLKIRRAVRKYHSSDYCIFLTFDFYNSFNSIPSLIFGDWTYQMLIEDRLNISSLQYRDLWFIRQQENAIKNAQIVLPLFGETVEKLRRNYPSANVHQIPFNVINNMSGISSLDNASIESKYNSCYVLFVGRKAYKAGLIKLIDAISSLEIPSLKIEVIGMSEKDFDSIPDFVHFNGFLHKDIQYEGDRYYELMKGAKCIINPTSKWAAYSSIVEGMFFYNPVIVTPFNQFVKEFGERINFGMYLNENDERSLQNCIKKMMSITIEEYTILSKNAHDRVKDYTWERYTDEMIEIMKNNKES